METRSFKILAVSIGKNHDGEPMRWFHPLQATVCTLVSNRSGHFMVQDGEIGDLGVRYQKLTLVMEEQKTGWERWDTANRGVQQWDVHSIRGASTLSSPHDTFSDFVEVATDDGLVFVIEVLQNGASSEPKKSLWLLRRCVREAMERQYNARLEKLQNRVGSKTMSYGLY